MAEKQTTKARDLIAPEKTVKVNGKAVKLVFNMYALSVTEGVYEDVYKKDKNASEIILEMTRGKMRAALAILYGFAVAGGLEDMDYNAFQAGLDMGQLAELNGIAQDGIIAMMPKKTDSKNG